MKKLRVELDARSYDILIGADLLGQLPEHLPQGKTYIITDENVARHQLANLEAALGRIEYKTKILPAGEKTKSFAMLEEVCDWLLEQKVERKTTIIAFGGGVIGDLVGFAASIVLRGINFIQVPTSLLAQVDSSVGGKTAVNSRYGKNLVGSFYQPRLVLADMDILATLPPREMVSGYAEIVKYGLINDPEFFEWLDATPLASPLRGGRKSGNTPLLSGGAGGGGALEEAIYKSCAAKAKIVAADEHEGGVRALLNLGHTFGHALEAETGFSDKLLHGEAVALGTVMAFRFSKVLGLCAQAEVDKVIAHFEKTALPVDVHKYLSEWDVDRLVEHMKSDKKVKDGKMVFILTRGIGKAFIDENIDEAVLRKFLENY